MHKCTISASLAVVLYLQAASDTSAPTDPQLTSRQNSASLHSSKQPSQHARLARAQAAARISTELQEVLRHASLAMLHLADADGVTGLHRHCLHTFGGLEQLVTGGDGTMDGESMRSSLSHPTHTAANKNAGVSLGTSDAVTAMLLQHPSSFVDRDAEQHQFDWLEGIALQVSEHAGPCPLQRLTVCCPAAFVYIFFFTGCQAGFLHSLAPHTDKTAKLLMQVLSQSCRSLPTIQAPNAVSV